MVPVPLLIRERMMQESVQNKLCRGCGTTQELSGFHKNRGTKDGLQGWCKSCSNQYQRERGRKLRGDPSQYRQILTKVCSRCSHEKPIGEFYRRANTADGHSHHCKECHKTRLKDRRNQIDTIKISIGCIACGERTPCCLHFHHLRDKKFTIGSYPNKSWDEIVEEIAKCIVLCANCHAKSHAGFLDLGSVEAIMLSSLRASRSA